MIRAATSRPVLDPRTVRTYAALMMPREFVSQASSKIACSPIREAEKTMKASMGRTFCLFVSIFRAFRSMVRYVYYNIYS